MNQPPPTQKQTGKRIVSKGEYVKAQGKKARLWSQAVCLLFMGVSILVMGLLYTRPLPPFFIPALSHPAFACICTLCALSLFIAAQVNIRRVRAIEPVILLTRANTANLPAPDSLVRASAEPVQEQQTVLLRAATDSVERHEEQLVRAAAGRAD